MKTVTRSVPRQRLPATTAAGGAFTLVELLAVIALLAIWAAVLVPALAHTRPGAQVLQCQNNLRQLAYGWKMYSADNSDNLVSSFPGIGSIPPIPTSWCYGNAEDGGPGNYIYDGADPAGIKTGLLWPYVRSLSSYKCPADHRVSSFGVYRGKPILRTFSMSSCLNGRTYGDPGGSWTFGGGSPPPASLKYNMYLKTTQILKPAQTMVILEEEPVSINDGMFIVDEEAGLGLVDLPSLQHSMGFGLNFADGHSQVVTFKDRAKYRPWVPGGYQGHDADWQQIRDFATTLATP
jgi:type II secretory pathway pseudopilin PulG